MWIWKHVGSCKVSACTSLTARWMFGSNGELVVNSPAGKNPKNPRQHAVQSMMWSWELQSRERLITCKTSIVLGRRLEVGEPCTCLVSLRSCWSCKQLMRGSANPLSMWRDRTALRYALREEWLRLSANIVAKHMRDCSLPERRAASGLRWPSSQQKSM